MEKNMAEEKFLIENYGKKGTFASFLPGISGERREALSGVIM